MYRLRTYLVWREIWVPILGLLALGFITLTTELSYPKWQLWNSLNQLIELIQLNYLAQILITYGILSGLWLHHRLFSRQFPIGRYGLILLLVNLIFYLGANRYLHYLGNGCLAMIGGIVLRLVTDLFDHDYSLISINQMVTVEWLIKLSLMLGPTSLNNLTWIMVNSLAIAWFESLVVLIVIYVLGVGLFRLNGREVIVMASGLAIGGSTAIVTIGPCAESNSDYQIGYLVAIGLLGVPIGWLIPYLGNRLGLSSDMISTWIGGSIDNLGTVMIIGSNLAVLIKILQLLLLGPLALFTTVVWAERLNLGTLWSRFPKFLVGYFISCLIVTALPSELASNLIPRAWIISQWLVLMSIIMIGYQIPWQTLNPQLIIKHWAIVSLFVIGQALDVGISLGLIYLIN